MKVKDAGNDWYGSGENSCSEKKRMVLGVIHFSNFSIEYGPLFPLHRITVRGYVTIVDRLLKSLF